MRKGLQRSGSLVMVRKAGVCGGKEGMVNGGEEGGDGEAARRALWRRAR